VGDRCLVISTGNPYTVPRAAAATAVCKEYLFCARRLVRVRRTDGRADGISYLVFLEAVESISQQEVHVRGMMLSVCMGDSVRHLHSD